MQVFIMRHGDAASMPPVIPFVLWPLMVVTNLAWWRTGWKVKSGNRTRSGEPVPASRANTGRSRGLSEPAFQCRSSAGLTPCGDVGLVSAYLQALTNEGVASVLVISHLPLVGYLVAELCPGETPPMFTTSAIASVTLDESGNGTFNWQMSPCNLKMAKAIWWVPNYAQWGRFIGHNCSSGSGYLSTSLLSKTLPSINKTPLTFIRKVFFCAYLDFAQSYMLKWIMSVWHSLSFINTDNGENRVE